MHASLFQPLGVAFTGTLPNAGLSASSYLQAQVFAKRVTAPSTTSGAAGDVTSALNIADESVVRGDGGAKGVQSSSMFIDDNANVIIGHTARISMGSSQTPQFQVIGNTTSGTSDNSYMGALAYNTAGVGPGLFYGLSRTATIGNHTAVQNNDTLGFLTYRGSDGTSFLDGGGIQMQVDAAVSANNISTRLVFYTTPAGVTPNIRMVLKPSGNLLLNSTGTTTETANAGRIQLGTSGSTTAADGLLLGTDVQFFRRAANVGRVPDSLEVTGSFALPVTDGVLLGAGAPGGVIAFYDSGRSANNRNKFSQWTAGTFADGFASDTYGATSLYQIVTGGQAAGVSLITWPISTSNVFGHTAANANAGVLQVRAGTQTTNIAGVGGTLYVNTTQTGNAAGVETNAFSHTIAGNTLTTNGASIEFYAAGTFATSVTVDKRVKVVYGATTLFDSGALAVTVAAEWSIRGSIIRTGAATQKASVTFTSSDAALRASTDYTTPAETLSGGVTMKLTVNGTNANDTVAELYKESWAAAA